MPQAGSNISAQTLKHPNHPLGLIQPRAVLPPTFFIWYIQICSGQPKTRARIFRSYRNLEASCRRSPVVLGGSSATRPPRGHHGGSQKPPPRGKLKTTHHPGTKASNSLVHEDTASFITPVASRPSALTVVKHVPASPQTAPMSGTARRPQSRRSDATAFFCPFCACHGLGRGARGEADLQDQLHRRARAKALLS